MLRIIEEIRRRLLEAVSESDAQQQQLMIGLARTFSKAASDMKFSPVIQLPMELAIVSWCLEDSGAGVSGKKKPNVVRAQAKNPSHELKKKNGIEMTGQAEGVQDDDVAVSSGAEDDAGALQASGSGVDLSYDDLLNRWPEVVQMVKPHSLSLGSLLKLAKPVSCSGNTVTLSVSYAFHMEQLQQDRACSGTGGFGKSFSGERYSV